MFKTRPVPLSLREVFGDTQSLFEMTAIMLFAIVATLATWWFFYLPFVSKHGTPACWREVLAFIILADIYAGCLANFTFGTEHFYMSKAKRRWVFIGIHVHLPVIAALLGFFINEAIVVWVYTIVTAICVNLLKGHRLQLFIAALCLVVGLIGLSFFSLPTWFYLICMFFLMKVSFSFAVQHYQKEFI